MIILTVIMGFIALIALAMPDLVLLGLFLIVPGIILMVAPTAFLYMASATAIRWLLPARTGVKATVLAFCTAGVLAALVAYPFRWIGEREYRASIQEDVVCASPLKLEGNIRLERRDVLHWKRGQTEQCDELCAALLLVPGVKSVTLANGIDCQNETTWKLVPRGSVPNTRLKPINPEQIFQHYPAEEDTDRVGGTRIHEFHQARREQLAAEWNLRLATRNTLVARDVAVVPDITIVITRSKQDSKPAVELVEVLGQSGRTLFRRSLVEHAVVNSPPYIAFHPSMSNSRFAIGRTKCSTGSRRERFDPITELIENVEGLRQTPSEDAPRLVKQRLVEALDNCSSDSDGLELAVPWIVGLGYQTPSDKDAEIVHRIVADLRVPDVGEALRRIYPKTIPLRYRSILVQRIIAQQTHAEDRTYYASLLSKMPPGTFADMTAEEWQVINDPSQRGDSAAFIERLADLGKPGVQPMLEILQHAVQTMPKWHQRKPVVQAVCRGLARLGPDANEALPMIGSLFEQQRCPITNSAGDALAWRIAMARMGLPIEELPHPPSWKEPAIAKMRNQVTRRLTKYDPDAGLW